MEIYFNIYDRIINNYDLKNKNYEILMNKNKIYNFNKIVIEDINLVINEDKIEHKFRYIYDIYNKMEISLQIHLF